MNLQQVSKSACSLLLFLLLAMGTFAQNRIITGTVRDKDGNPLEGVTVTVKGQTGSVVTDEKGYYAIKSATGETLTFTHISFTTREMKVGSDDALNLSMTKTENPMEEVVVVGYGTQKKIHLTGSVATVDMKQIEDIPVGSMSAALRGTMPGINVAGGYSRPGNPATITVRNPLFLSKDGGKTAPLYIIDDVIRSQTDFNLLDQSEIESFSILKDAAAAIYGIQGANGVIVVRTKRGKSGAPRVNYSGSVGVTDRVFSPKMMSGYEQAVYLNDMYREQKINSSDMRYYTQDELEHFAANNYNWLDMAWQKSYQTRHAINVSGGSERATYFAGFTYNTQNGNFDGINYNKYTFRASSDIKLATGLKLGLSLSGALSDNKQVFSKQGGESLDNDWKTLTQTPQFNPPFVNGLPILLASANSSTIDNYHFFAIQNSGHFAQTKGSALNFQGQLNYDLPFVKGLSAGLTFNKNISNDFGKQYGTFYKVYTFSMLGGHNHIYGGDVVKTDQLENGNRVRLNPTMTDVYQLNATLRYDRQFGKHHVSVLGVYEQSETKSDGIAGMVEGVIVGGLPNTRYATGAQTATETQTELGRLAYLGRLDYNYASKYLLQFTLRADASTLFAPENRWGYFPSVSAGWVISEEPFFGRALNVVNFFKLRG
jgi:TonB-linked SusC/RagA family outer membrane protein